MESMQRFDLAILVGSDNDKPAITDSKMTEVLDVCGIAYDVSVISGDRNFEDLGPFCQEKLGQGVMVFIAIAGLTNVLAGLVTANIKLVRPVIGVALGGSNTLAGQASLASITFKPRGTPVAAAGIDKHGLVNAALLACQMIALQNPQVAESFANYVATNTPKVQLGWVSKPRLTEGE